MNRKMQRLLLALCGTGLAIAGFAAAQMDGEQPEGTERHGMMHTGGLMSVDTSTAFGVEERELTDLGGGVKLVEERVGDHWIVVEETTLAFTGDGVLVWQCARGAGSGESGAEATLGAAGLDPTTMEETPGASEMTDQTVLGVVGACVLVEERMAAAEAPPEPETGEEPPVEGEDGADGDAGLSVDGGEPDQSVMP